MVHGMRGFENKHAVIAGQFFHFCRCFLAPYKKEKTHLCHFGRADGLQVAQAGNQQNSVAIERQDIAHQVAGKGAGRFFVEPVGAADDSGLG